MHLVSVLKTRPHDWKLGAETIMLVEGVDFSHVAVSYKCPYTKLRYVVEARGGGIRLISNNEFKRTNFIVSGSTYEVDTETLNAIHIYCYGQLALDYGYKHLVGLGLMRTKQCLYDLLTLERRANNPFKDGEYSQICVELGIRVMSMCKPMVLPLHIENYGLREYNKLDLKHGTKMPQERINKINGIEV